MNVHIKLVSDIFHVQTGDKLKKIEWRNIMDLDASPEDMMGH